ncbi:hypothetical protein FRX31_031094 [Thalictrum thalictroides]|uniref:Uncharacterized protein n=1 Tax=Thalictrum thalictroides TaxID=46969 RepID=A0A7J6V3E6_THATH|nr:hypothetical protein FRX31_031094 [Thalictrum thalictroides]
MLRPKAVKKTKLIRGIDCGPSSYLMGHKEAMEHQKEEDTEEDCDWDPDREETKDENDNSFDKANNSVE